MAASQRSSACAPVLGLVDREIRAFPGYAGRPCGSPCYRRRPDSFSSHSPVPPQAPARSLTARGKHRLKAIMAARPAAARRSADAGRPAGTARHSASTMPIATRSQPAPSGAATGVGGPSASTTSSTSSTSKRIGVAVRRGRRWRRAPPPSPRAAELQRGEAVDHGQHPAAQRGQAGDMGRGARRRGEPLELDHRLDVGGGKGDAAAGEAGDQEQLSHGAAFRGARARRSGRRGRSGRCRLALRRRRGGARHWRRPGPSSLLAARSRCRPASPARAMR